ncbi:MAG: aldehyde dehydrogenase (NADP(+)) [Propionicimonas sp.]
MTLQTTDPKTGISTITDIEVTSERAVTETVQRASNAAAQLAGMRRGDRAALLDSLARHLEQDHKALVAIADRETGLGPVRLQRELARAVFQLRFFADVLREGSYLEAAIDHAAQTPLGPMPDIRRMLVPLGPVAVFGSSNFPFAFSVPGGDTASAIAAGCPVVVKAHSSHPLTSRLAFEALRRGARESDAPDGLLGIVYGQPAGIHLVTEGRIRAVGFTGSHAAAKTLLQSIESRAESIPFHGELGSVNPLIVTPGAASARADKIAAGLHDSFTSSGGQLCTKPGLAFIPKSGAGDQLVNELAAWVSATDPHPLLNARIHTSFTEVGERLMTEGRATLAATGRSGVGISAAARMLQLDLADFTETATEEAFGPLLVVVRYDSLDLLGDALALVPRSLTATLHLEPEEFAVVTDLLRQLQDRAGRVVFNGYPTGVRVSWAQHHGGPWPSTNTLHTSVGATAIRRFLRPQAWQSAPAELLPDDLRDGPVDIPRRIDGQLVLPLASRKEAR